MSGTLTAYDIGAVNVIKPSGSTTREVVEGDEVVEGNHMECSIYAHTFTQMNRLSAS